MAFEVDANLPPALTPLAWLVGRWEGAGVLGYPTMESAQFGQEIVCSHDGRPFLEWQSRTWLLDDAGDTVRPLAVELGFWRGLANGEIEFLLTHPSGVLEMYVGHRDPAKPSVQRSPVAPSDPQAWVRQVTEKAAASRGLRPPLVPDLADIADPYRREDEAFAAMAQQVVESMPAVRSLAG